MLQNPHRQPDIHPGAKGGGSESTGALRDMGLATAPAGGDPTTSRQISHVISPRSLFETTRKRCNSNDVDSTFELIAGELRATFMGGGRAWPSFETTRRRHADRMLLMVQNPHQYPWRHAPTLASRSHPGVMLPPWRHAPSLSSRSLTGAALPGGTPINARKASPVMAGASRATSSATGLVSDEAKHPIGDHPTRSDRAQCSRSGGIFPYGSNAPKRVERSRSGVILPTGRILSEAVRRERTSPTLLP